MHGYEREPRGWYDLPRYSGGRMWGPWREEWGEDDRRDLPDERLRVVVYVDGRLVDTWSEEVEASPWAEVAARFDREREHPAPPPPPPPPVPPLHERVLAALDDVCGGREAVLALDGEALDDEPDLPEAEPRAAWSRLSAVAELLDAAAAQLGHREAAVAFRRCLLAVWERAPEVVLDAATAAHVAGGVTWVVLKANAQLGVGGLTTVTRLKELLGLGVQPSGYGKVVQRALVGYRDLGDGHRSLVAGLPALLPLGRPDVLFGATRRTLVRSRELALEAQAAAGAA